MSPTIASSGRRERLCDNGKYTLVRTSSTAPHTSTRYYIIKLSSGDKNGRGVKHLLQRVLQLVEFLLVLEASVHHKQKHRGTEVATGKFILDRRELWQQLSGEILFGDVRCVVRRELVSRPSERTGPSFCVIVNCAMWVQDAAAAVAADRLILKGPWGVFGLLKRGIPVCAYGVLENAWGRDISQHRLVRFKKYSFF